MRKSTRSLEHYCYIIQEQFLFLKKTRGKYTAINEEPVSRFRFGAVEREASEI